jgi:tripeptidyl-peptidase-1
VTTPIVEVFAPTVETLNAMKEWLSSHGIEQARLSISKGSSWILFSSTIGEAEALLQTKYKVSVLLFQEEVSRC